MIDKMRAYKKTVTGACFSAAVAVFVFMAAVFCPVTSADTVMMKSGQEMKGVVVEDYTDRITLSTGDGEVSVMKSEIGKLVFDDEETNFIKLAEQALDNKRYLKAVEYYSKALKMNPHSKEAKDGLIFLQLHLYDKERSMKEADIRRRGEAGQSDIPEIAEENEAEELKRYQKSLRDLLGIVLSVEENIPVVRSVKPNSAAHRAGIRKSDMLVAIWGRLTGYMSAREVTERLLSGSSSEIRCTIQRAANVGTSNGSIGASLAMEFDGLTVSDVKRGGPAEKAGLEKGDLIVAIENTATRYMPLKRALETIKSHDEGVWLTFRRNMVMWRKGQ